MAVGLLRNVSDTALWVASYRATESERPDALFRDPWARRLAGERGAALGSTIRSRRDVEWAVVVRTALFDEVVTERVAAGADAVLNLAAGLDTRPYRLGLPASLLWVEVDLPGIFDYKEEVLDGERPTCRLERVRLDLSRPGARRELLADVAGRCREVLVLSEGLMLYLGAEDATGLAADLHGAGSFRWWLMDLDSPRLLRFMEHRWGQAFERAGAPLRFAPEEGADYFRPFGWRLAREYSFMEECHRLRRGPTLGPLWRLFGDYLPVTWRYEILRLATASLLERA